MSDYFQEMGWNELGDGESPDHLLHLARLLRDFGMFDMLGQNMTLPPPAAKHAIENLKERQIKVSSAAGSNASCAGASNQCGEDNNDEQCAICLKQYIEGETVKVMPCKHNFHSTCILLWLDKTNSCPVCRYELPTDDEDYELYRKEKIREKQREQDIEQLHNSMFS